MTEDEARRDRERSLCGKIGYHEGKIEKAKVEAHYDGKIGLGLLGFSAIAGGVIGLLKGVAGMTIEDTAILGLIPVSASSGLFGIYTLLKAIGRKLGISRMKALKAFFEKELAELNNPKPHEDEKG